MSTFLGYESYLISLGSSIEDVRTTFKNAITAYGWQCIGGRQQYMGLKYTNFTLADAQSIFSGFDGASYCISSALPATVGVQLATAAQVTKYCIRASTFLTGVEPTPKSWTLEWSDNGTTWSGGVTGGIADTRTNETGWFSGEIRYYEVGGTPGAHAYWRLNITASCYGGTTTYLGSVRLYLSNGDYVSSRSATYLIPPSSESIGDTHSKELLILDYNTTGTAMTIMGSQVRDTGLPQSYVIKETTAGAITPTVYFPSGATFNATASINTATLTVTAASGTITVGSIISGNFQAPVWVKALGTGTGGAGTYTIYPSQATTASRTITVQPVTAVSGTAGTTGTTAKENLRSLYTAMKDSAVSPATDWDYTYNTPAPQNANDTLDHINCFRKTYSTTNSYISGDINHSPVMTGGYYYPNHVIGLEASILNNTASTTQNLTIDLVSGFIYYLQCNARSIHLATKTNTSVYGPIHASYCDHTKAVAAMPTVLNGNYLSPIELVIGYDGASSVTTSTMVPTKIWGLPHTNALNAFNYNGTYSSGYVVGLYYAASQRDIFFDVMHTSNSGAILTTQLSASGISVSADNSIDDFQIHSMVMRGAESGSPTISLPSQGTALVVCPQLDVQDWYKFRGTATNESLAIVADTTALTTLNQTLDATTAYTTLTLTSTAGFASAGFVVIERELFQYTGKSGNDLTGVTRQKYGSTKQNHWVGDAIYQGVWFTIMNGGALYCGYTKPA